MRIQKKEGMFIRCNLVFIVLLLTTLASSASAGTIEGNTSLGKSVVYVDAIPGKTFPAPSQKSLMGQKGLMFTPHIVVIQQGATVDFQNDDTVQHNVFWPFISGNKKEGHNLGTWPKGDKRSFKFDYPGVVPLLCNVHAEMSGYIVVSPTPYFAETDASGNYKIENVPDGKYSVIAWHEGTKPQTKAVTVNGTAKADFTMAK